MTDRIVKVVLRGDIGQFVGSMRASASAVKSTVGSMTEASAEAGKFRKNLSTVGDSAGRMGLAVTAGLAPSAKAAIDWETAWAGVTKTVDGSASQMATLEQGLRDLATTLPATHQEIAAVAEAAGQLGVAREDILTFTKTMIDLGETTNLTADEAATSIAQLANVMGTAPDEIDNLGSALVALGNDGASTERDIIQMAQRIAGAGKIIGLSEGDVLGLANALASVGIDAEAGGSSVSRILIDISKAVSTNSADLAKWASVSGMSVKEFSEQWKTSPAEGFAAFTEGLGKVNDAGGDVFTTLSELGQTDVRVTQALLGMAGSGDLLTDSLMLGAEAWRTNTALAAEAEKRYATTGSEVRVAWNQIKDAAIDAGTVLLPVVSKVASGISDIAKAFGSLPGPVQTGVVVFAAIGGAALLLIGGLARVVTSVATTRAALDGLAISGTRAGTAMTVLTRAGTGLAAFWAGAAVGDKIGERNAKGIDKMADSLVNLGKTGKVTGDLADLFGADLSGKTVKFGKDLGSIGEALKSLDGYADDNSLTETLKFFGSGGQSAGITQQAEALGDLDKAFAELSRNKPDEAIKAFAALRDRVLETGGSAKDLERAFPTMVGLLRSASEASGGTSDASEVLKGNLQELAPATAALTEEQQALNDANRETAESFIDLSDDADEAKESLSSWIKDLAGQADALNNFTANAVKAGKRGLEEGLIDKLREMGPEGAARLKELANASDSELERANRAWRRGQRAIENYVDEFGEVPDGVSTTISTPGLGRASANVGTLLGQLGQLDKTDVSAVVRIGITGANLGSIIGQINKIKNSANGNIFDFYADGGIAENHVAQIAPAGAMRVWAEPETGGEAYIPFAASKRKRSQQIALETVSRLGGTAYFANGGTTGGSGGAADFDGGALAAAVGSATAREMQRVFNQGVRIVGEPGNQQLKLMGA